MDGPETYWCYQIYDGTPLTPPERREAGEQHRFVTTFFALPAHSSACQVAFTGRTDIRATRNTKSLLCGIASAAHVLVGPRATIFLLTRVYFLTHATGRFQTPRTQAGGVASAATRAGRGHNVLHTRAFLDACGGQSPPALNRLSICDCGDVGRAWLGLQAHTQSACTFVEISHLAVLRESRVNRRSHLLCRRT